ncbi:MAG TPA: biotin synthase BioB, partial [Phycisphaerae bacterium]|nr:biotin synthase BioB [Phycisphaerae bacterium]
MHAEIARLGARTLDGERLGRAELLTLANLSLAHLNDVLYWTSRIRTAVFGRQVRFCSIIAGKLGGCSEDCKWCAQAAGRMDVRRTSTAQIASAADQAGKLGAASFGIVNSGRSPTAEDLDHLTAALAAIAAVDNPPPPVCASLGELTPNQACRLADAGIRRYNHNLETSDAFFPKVVTTHAYTDRLASIEAARQAGMQICCGGLFGMGETWADRIDLALMLRDRVRPDVVPLNFLNPAPGTALASAPQLKPREALAITAVFRWALPLVDLKIAGGREATLRDMQSWMFHAGATSCIIGN